METIGQSAFAAYDTLLYMDTHPQDREAMAYYHKQSAIRREAMEEYARRFGPLTMDLIDESNCDTQGVDDAAMAMGKIPERQVLVYVDL